ncbi:hypothetical protein CGGC5_v014686 [Colletotrichum fructicola Nara gc5]|uniref:Uncharacterized protein n=1 Tax=Colletotrichum fructicola (strain Nara gc5) TaxID=1213859 RepID=A0A7J6IKK6_COLFN|nr:hypothetical protein CGGC5_v014686 [Colletotrichum fructicola Nara gc5]KAF5483375.1 hypothetical protein CGCF413_v014691 [Colletotrichum fructicola]
MPLVRKVGGSLPISGCSNRAPAALVWGSWGKDKEEEEEEEEDLAGMFSAVRIVGRARCNRPPAAENWDDFRSSSDDRSRLWGGP